MHTVLVTVFVKGKFPKGFVSMFVILQFKILLNRPVVKLWEDTLSLKYLVFCCQNIGYLKLVVNSIFHESHHLKNFKCI